MHASPPAGGLTFASVASDVRELMDAMAIDRAVMMGASGGGPHAAACAALLPPSRTAGLVLLAGMTHTTGAPADVMQGE